MKSHHLLIKFFIVFFLIINSSLLHAQQNTILIIADDLSPDYIGCFSTTTDTANVPAIRALADRGVRFTKVWSAPVCSPARAGILTGRYPFRTGVGGVITSTTSPQIDTAEMSIAKLLKFYAPTTYNTACVGKWHLTVNQPLKRLDPNKLGFNFYSGNFNGAIPNYYNYGRVKNGIMDTVTTYATTQTVNDAIGWLDTMNASKPFFLWLAFNAPHDPYHVPPSTLCDTTGLIGTTADITANPEKYFKAALTAMDTEIGRLFSYLQTHNLMDSTNIIFIGDNGNQGQVAQIANPTKSKGTIYDYGVRVPMIVAGPAVGNPNRNCNELVSTVDLFATMNELCGFNAWKNFIPSSTSIDSKSFLPLITNQTGDKRTWIFAETFNTPSTTDDGKTIRNQDYHLLRFDNGAEEFYNQTLDIEENNNLLLSASSMSSIDINNYHFLCDSISLLTGVSGCSPLIVRNDNAGHHISFYPNPSNGIYSIQWNGNYSNKKMNVHILNQLGQVLSSLEINESSDKLDLSNYSNGLYFVEIISDDNKSYQSILKE